MRIKIVRVYCEYKAFSDVLSTAKTIPLKQRLFDVFARWMINRPLKSELIVDYIVHLATAWVLPSLLRRFSKCGLPMGVELKHYSLERENPHQEYVHCRRIEEWTIIGFL